MDYRQHFIVQPGSSVNLAAIAPDFVPRQPVQGRIDGVLGRASGQEAG
jgi:hypothetical protein